MFLDRVHEFIFDVIHDYIKAANCGDLGDPASHLACAYNSQVFISIRPLSVNGYG